MAKKRSEQEIETALTLAATIGIRPAAAQLNIPQATVHAWTRDQPERYAEIKTELAPKWRARAAAATENTVDSLAELEQAAIDKLAEDLTHLEPKEVSGALKNITVAKGINSDHVAKLRGQPSVTVEHTVNMPQIDQAIGLLLNRGAVDAEAVELEAGER